MVEMYNWRLLRSLSGTQKQINSDWQWPRYSVTSQGRDVILWIHAVLHSRTNAYPWCRLHQTVMWCFILPKSRVRIKSKHFIRFPDYKEVVAHLFSFKVYRQDHYFGEALHDYSHRLRRIPKHNHCVMYNKSLYRTICIQAVWAKTE